MPQLTRPFIVLAKGAELVDDIFHTGTNSVAESIENKTKGRIGRETLNSILLRGGAFSGTLIVIASDVSRSHEPNIPLLGVSSAVTLVALSKLTRASLRHSEQHPEFVNIYGKILRIMRLPAAILSIAAIACGKYIDNYVMSAIGASLSFYTISFYISSSSNGMLNAMKKWADKIIENLRAGLSKTATE